MRSCYCEHSSWGQACSDGCWGTYEGPDVHLCSCSGLWDEWGAEAVGDLPPGGGAQRSRPSASGEKSYCQHPKVHTHIHKYAHTNTVHMYVVTEYNTLGLNVLNLSLKAFLYSILLYSVLFYSTLFFSTLFYFILFVLFYCVLFFFYYCILLFCGGGVPFCFILFCFVLFGSILSCLNYSILL